MEEQTQALAPSGEKNNLRLYSFLARRVGPKTYLGKIMLVAFLGTHIPLLTLFFYAIESASMPSSVRTSILIVALVATLVGTGLTLFVLRKLLSPITHTYQGLRKYLESGTLPSLPTHFKDEAGVLMADTMFAVSKLDESIHQLKNYDSLTSLPNRALFSDQLGRALAQARRDQKSLAVMLLDIDGFAAVNNTLGHESGDRLLRQVAQRLSGCVREVDVLSRISGDEFAVLHAPLQSVEDATAHSQRMLKALAEPITLDGKEVHLGASIGIALFGGDEEGSETLLAHADSAMHLAKEEGRNTFRYYSQGMNEALARRLEIERDLRHALDRDELELFFQPQIDLKNGGFTGAEALLRWNHPKRGRVSPADFIPIAESSGLIVPIGEWVMRRACEQNLAWRKSGMDGLRVAVNLSAPQFQQTDLIELVAKVLHDTRHDAKYLELEITEGLIMNDVHKAIGVLQGLHGLGVTLALDDFGTGYSSLSYLKRLPLDFLKIDQSFVRGIPSDANDMAITQSVIALAHGLQLDVIAEGVETIEQANYLESHGCTKLQGFYFGRPTPARDFALAWEKNAHDREDSRRHAA